MKKSTIHGSAIAYEGKGVLILGQPGSGKSALCMRLIEQGCDLIGDDLVDLYIKDNCIYVAENSKSLGAIEFRYIGLFHTKTQQEANLAFVVNLSKPSNKRLPNAEYFEHGGLKVPSYNAKGLDTIASFVALSLKNKIWSMKI